jgi:glycosyltransferase involved in cell wall biosynthesis
MQRLWITWENQRRNRELSKALGARLFELAEIDRMTNRLKKYLSGIIKTLLILAKEKPEVVFCQNPSLILALFCVVMRPFFRYRLCVDAHNAGLFPAEGESPPLMTLARFIQRHADLTIITNKPLKEHVESHGGRAFVLPDRIPTFSHWQKLSLKGRINILFICTYAADEPYQAVLEAARDLPDDVVIYVTGNFLKKGLDPTSLSKNVVLTGFIPEEEYISLLHSVDATIDLTTRENCLVCGAYETVAVENVMILSDTRALRDYFFKGAVYVANTREGVRQAIEDVCARHEHLKNEVMDLKQILENEWEQKRCALEATIASWT